MYLLNRGLTTQPYLNLQYLHSTMYLLNHKDYEAYDTTAIDLHSTMYLLNRFKLVPAAAVWYDLHSTMYLLNLIVGRHCPSRI